MSDQLQLAQQLNQTLESALSNVAEIESRVTTQIGIINNLNSTIENMTTSFSSFESTVVSFNQNLTNIMNNIRSSFNLEELTSLYEELEEHVNSIRRDLNSTTTAVEELSEATQTQTNNANTAAAAASENARNVSQGALQVSTFGRTTLQNVSGAQSAISDLSNSLQNTAESAQTATEEIQRTASAMESAMAGIKGLFKSIKSIIGSAFQLLKSILTLPAQVAKIAVKAGNALRVDLVEVIGNAREEFKNFFDLTSNIGQGIKKLGRVGAGMLGTFQVAGSRMVKLFGFGTQGIVNMMNEFKDVLVALGPFAEVYGNTIGDSKEQIEFFIMMKRAFGLTAEDYAYYGQDAAKNMQSLNDRIYEMGMTVFAVADSYGLDRKRMSLNFQKLRKQIVLFDHLTDEELSNTTARITQLGVKLEDVAAVFNKFSTFEDAAKSVALLSQTFGMNLDAMELIKAEKPEEIFEMFRNTMMETGRSFEDLNRFEKQLMANQTGMSAETLKSVMNYRTAGLTYEQAVEKANQNKPEKKQLKALKELRSAIKEIQKVMQFESPFQAFFKGMKANMLATGEFSGTLTKLSSGYESIYNYAAGLDENTFYGILKPVKMIVDILSKLVTSGGFKKGLVTAVETLGNLVSGAFGIGEGVRETYNIVQSIGKLASTPSAAANPQLATLLAGITKKAQNKFGVSADYLKSISKKSTTDQIRLLLIQIRKNVIKDRSLTEAHDTFIKKFQATYSTIDTSYQAKYNLVDEIKQGMKEGGMSMADSAGEYAGLAGTIAGAILKGALIVLTAGLEFLGESLKPISDEVSNFNNTSQSKNTLEKIFGWDAGDMHGMITGLGSAFIGLFTTGNNMSVMYSFVKVFLTVIGNALMMAVSLLKGMLWDSWSLGGNDKAGDLLANAEANANAGSSVGLSSAYNELKFDQDQSKYEDLIRSIDKIQFPSGPPRQASQGSGKAFNSREKSRTADALSSAGIRDKQDHKELQADLIAQTERVGKEIAALRSGKGPAAQAAHASYRRLLDLQSQVAELKKVMETQDDWIGGSDDYVNPQTGVSFDMEREQLTAELLRANAEMTSAYEGIRQGKAYKDGQGTVRPGQQMKVNPINNKTNIQTSGQSGFTRSAFTKLEKSESDSKAILDMTDYQSQTKNISSSNESTRINQCANNLSSSIGILSQVFKGEASRENEENDLFLTDDVIQDIFKVGCSLGAVDILSDVKYGQGRTILGPLATAHTALQPGRVNRGQTTSYDHEHDR